MESKQEQLLCHAVVSQHHIVSFVKGHFFYMVFLIQTKICVLYVNTSKDEIPTHCLRMILINMLLQR